MARRRDDDDDEGDDDDLKQYVVTGDELKKLVRLGRKRPMPFAFCPANGEDESLFATHRKKSAKKIGKATKEDSGQTKVAWGTFVIIDRVIVLTCTRVLPGIAKKLKKHMRAERLPLNIRVLDGSGTEVESDIEDLSAEADPFEGMEDEDGEPQGTGDRLRDRLAELGPVVRDARGDAGDRLRDLWQAALRASESGSRDKAQRLLALVERDAKRLTHSAGAATARVSPAVEASPARPVKEPEVDEEPADDKAQAREIMRLARRLAGLRPRAGALPDPAAQRITAALALIARQLRSGAREGAEDGLDRIEAAMARVEQKTRAAG